MPSHLLLYVLLHVPLHVLLLVLLHAPYAACMCCMCCLCHCRCCCMCHCLCCTLHACAACCMHVLLRAQGVYPFANCWYKNYYHFQYSCDDGEYPKQINLITAGDLPQITGYLNNTVKSERTHSILIEYPAKCYEHVPMLILIATPQLELFLDELG